MIYRDDGYIITSYHIISNAVENEKDISKARIEVVLPDKRNDVYEAQLVGKDKNRCSSTKN